MKKPLALRPEDVGPFSKAIGLGFEKIEEGYSLGRLEVRDDLLNFNGDLHGGVIYAMADTGMGGALVPCLERDERCTTVEIKIVYLNAVTVGTLTCETRLVHRGKRIAVLESNVENSGRPVARALGTYYVSKAKAKANADRQS